MGTCWDTAQGPVGTALSTLKSFSSDWLCNLSPYPGILQVRPLLCWVAWMTQVPPTSVRSTLSCVRDQGIIPHLLTSARPPLLAAGDRAALPSSPIVSWRPSGSRPH